MQASKWSAGSCATAVRGASRIGWVIGAGLLLAGCANQGGLLGQVGLGPKDIDTYTRIQVKNPISIERPDEIVEVPLSVVKTGYKNFYEKDFSVHLLDTALYSEGDPLLATNPPPEVPAQLADRDLDGEMDTLLLSLDFHAGESLYLAVCSPRFSVRVPRPETGVNAGLWQRETVKRTADGFQGEGGFLSLDTETLSSLHRPGDGLYFMDGVMLESESVAYRLLFDRRLAMDVIGKQVPGLWVDRVVSGEVAAERLPAGTGEVLLGDPPLFGACSLAMAEAKSLESLGPFHSVQYRLAANGPVAGEVEILLGGCQLGGQAVDVTWRISCFRGSNHLEHRMKVSAPGHQLAIAVHDAASLRREIPSARTGWMKCLSYGAENVTSGAGGRLGLALITKGAQCIGFGEGQADRMGMRFDPMLKSFVAYTIASWSDSPGGAQSLDELETMADDLVLRVNNPIRCLSKDYRGN